MQAPCDPSTSTVSRTRFPKRDAAGFLRRFRKVATKCGFRSAPLESDSQRLPSLALWVREPRGGAETRASLLVTCGFHGEEVGGPLGALEFLRHALREEEQSPDRRAATLLRALDESGTRLAIAPLINATGFAAGTRFNRWNENPNHGFAPNKFAPNKFAPNKETDCLSREARVMVANKEALWDLARDGLLTCHESVGEKRCYVYALERGSKPSALVETVLGASGLRVVGPNETVDGGVRHKDGIVFNHADSSFECWMMGSNKIKRALCTETPGRGHHVAKRVHANSRMIRAFCLLSMHAAAK